MSTGLPVSALGWGETNGSLRCSVRRVRTICAFSSESPKVSSKTKKDLLLFTVLKKKKTVSKKLLKIMTKLLSWQHCYEFGKACDFHVFRVLDCYFHCILPSLFFKIPRLFLRDFGRLAKAQNTSDFTVLFFLCVLFGTDLLFSLKPELTVNFLHFASLLTPQT